jgi:hypothetical protein
MLLDCNPNKIQLKTALHFPEIDVIRKCGEVGEYTRYIASCIWNKEIYSVEQDLYRFLKLRRFSDENLEAACRRAVFYNCCSNEMVYMIVSHGLYRLPLDADTDVFGQKYFNFVDCG